MDKELAVTEILEQTPEDLLLAARDAAQALERVIDLNDKPPLVFKGKRYLQIEHWQTIGAFYHCSVRTHEAEPCEIDTVKGFVAKCDLLNDRTGAIVGGSVAYCMRDEPNWKDKPMYALASMAQTRAGSKALSNKFRFVAVVAGYEGCSAEEVTDEMRGLPPVKMPQSKTPSSDGNVPRATPSMPSAHETPGPRPLTEEETKALMPPTSKFFAQLHKTAREKKISPEGMKKAMKELFGKDSSKDLLDHECAMLIKAIEGGSVK